MGRQRTVSQTATNLVKTVRTFLKFKTNPNLQMEHTNLLQRVRDLHEDLVASGRVRVHGPDVPPLLLGAAAAGHRLLEVGHW